MHSTCLYCTKDLGANEVLETLPIGRRIAFDASTGRLWVVCRHCAKWNLVPFDNRLETIDMAERLFRDTPTRYSTEHIGLAKVREGLELVRIGGAERREFAAWRYGRSMAKRRQRARLVLQGSAFVLGAILVREKFATLSLFPLLGAAGGAWWNGQIFSGWIRGRMRRLKVVSPTGAMVRTFTHEALDAAVLRLREDGTIDVILKQHGEWWEYEGDEARRLAGRVLPKTNLFDGTDEQVADATRLLSERAGWDGLVRLSTRGTINVPLLGDAGGIEGRRSASAASFGAIDPAIRLALEMAAHEDSERQWLAGELALLEREWREADRLAKISDGLVLDDVELPTP